MGNNRVENSFFIGAASRFFLGMTEAALLCHNCAVFDSAEQIRSRLNLTTRGSVQQICGVPILPVDNFVENCAQIKLDIGRVSKFGFIDNFDYKITCYKSMG